MNYLFYRRTLILAIIVSTTIANSQYKRSKLSFEVGFNTVDVRAYTTDVKTLLKDYFGPTEWLGNTAFYPSRFAVQKYIGDKISLQLAISVNTIKTNVSLKDSDFRYYSVELIFKKDLTRLFPDIKWFDPYLLGGIGSQTIDTYSDIVFIGGFGFNIWTGTHYGVNFQTSYKHGFNNHGRDVFQHSINFVYDFSFFSLEQRKRVWNQCF